MKHPLSPELVLHCRAVPQHTPAHPRMSTPSQQAPEAEHATCRTAPHPPKLVLHRGLPPQHILTHPKAPTP